MALIQNAGVHLRRGNFDTGGNIRYAHTHVTMVVHREKVATCKSRREALEESNLPTS